MPKAIVYTETGPPEVLHLADVDVPRPGPGQVRLVVRAAGVNPIDHKIRSGAFAREWLAEVAAGRPELDRLLAAADADPIEEGRRRALGGEGGTPAAGGGEPRRERSS